MRWLSFFRRDGRWRTIGLPAAVIAAVSVAFGIGAVGWIDHSRGPVDRARHLAATGNFLEAEQLYLEVLQQRPLELNIFIELVDNRAALSGGYGLPDQFNLPGQVEKFEPPFRLNPIDDSRLEDLLARGDLIGHDLTLARFWLSRLQSPATVDSAVIRELAAADPPPAWANRLLARMALDQGEFASAATLFAREGLESGDGSVDDLSGALGLWMHAGEWHEVRVRLEDPRWSDAIDARVRLAVAEHDRDWPKVLLWLWAAGFVNIRAWPVVLAIASAVLWFLLVARMGELRGSTKGRGWLYLAAFCLGVVSIYPTLILITVEEMFFNLTPDGQPITDAIYFVAGVGLREEAAKLLLFLPLLPFLRRRQSRLEALVCGAFVGLGFAAEENIGYFHNLAVDVAVARFLTANFLHMALTALAALALYDGSRAHKGEDFGTVFPLAVLLHGAYDFFLVSPSVSGDASFLAMTIFILLSQRFIREMQLLGSSGQDRGLLRHFILSLTALTGLSYVYAATLVGPFLAFGQMAGGLLGVAILVVMFTRELST